MPKKKRKKKSLFRRQVKQGLVTGTSAVGVAALPNTPATATTKSNILGGIGTFASTARTRGALAGTNRTVRGVGRVVRTTKKLSGKKRRKKR